MPLQLHASCRSNLVVCGLSGKRYSGVAEFHEMLKPLLPAGVVLIPRDGLCSLEALHRYVRWAPACFFIRIEAAPNVREANGWRNKFGPEDLVRDEHWTEVGLDDWDGWDAVVQHDGNQQTLLRTAEDLAPRIAALCQTPALTKHLPIPEASVKRTEFTTPMPDCMKFGGAEAYVPSQPPVAHAEVEGASARVQHVRAEQVAATGSPTQSMQRPERLDNLDELEKLETKPAASSPRDDHPLAADRPGHDATGSDENLWWQGYQSWDNWPDGYSWRGGWNWASHNDEQAANGWWNWQARDPDTADVLCMSITSSPFWIAGEVGRKDADQRFSDSEWAQDATVAKEEALPICDCSSYSRAQGAMVIRSTTVTQAADCLEEAIALNPGFKQAYLEFDQACTALRDFPRCRRVAQKLVDHGGHWVNCWQRPLHFHAGEDPKVTSRPWYEPEQFELVRCLEENFAVIQRELCELSAPRGCRWGGVGTAHRGNQNSSHDADLVAAGEWQEVVLLGDSDECNENCLHCPARRAELPRCPAGSTFLKASFRELKPVDSKDSLAPEKV
ncbi:unnamed protein product [Symbiodinium sp. CCMP2456]|nr:unnamed protein product [Symbiodinium sp. CCMP2456]